MDDQNYSGKIVAIYKNTVLGLVVNIWLELELLMILGGIVFCEDIQPGRERAVSVPWSAANNHQYNTSYITNYLITSSNVSLTDGTPFVPSYSQVQK